MVGLLGENNKAKRVHRVLCPISIAVFFPLSAMILLPYQYKDVLKPYCKPKQLVISRVILGLGCRIFLRIVTGEPGAKAMVAAELVAIPSGQNDLNYLDTEVYLREIRTCMDIHISSCFRPTTPPLRSQSQPQVFNALRLRQPAIRVSDKITLSIHEALCLCGHSALLSIFPSCFFSAEECSF